MSKYSPVGPHGKIIQVFEGIYVVQGTNVTHFDNMRIQHSRNMTIIECNGELTLINTVRLNEQGLMELDKLGSIKHVISIGAFHGKDDAFYLDRSNAKFWTVQVNPCYQPTHYLNDTDELPIRNGLFYMFENSSPAEGFIYLAYNEGIIITCDSIKNWVNVDRFFSEETTKIALSDGEISKARISPIWLKATGLNEASFDRLLNLEFKHLISAHGEVLRDTAYYDIQNSVREIC